MALLASTACGGQPGIITGPWEEGTYHRAHGYRHGEPSRRIPRWEGGRGDERRGRWGGHSARLCRSQGRGGRHRHHGHWRNRHSVRHGPLGHLHSGQHVLPSHRRAHGDHSRGPHGSCDHIRDHPCSCGRRRRRHGRRHGRSRGRSCGRSHGHRGNHGIRRRRRRHLRGTSRRDHSRRRIHRDVCRQSRRRGGVLLSLFISNCSAVRWETS